MPSSRQAKQAILALIPLNAKIIFELGSGWGGLALAIGSKRPDATIFAYEVSFVPWLFSVFLKKMRKVKNVKFIRKNFFNHNFSAADCLVCYLYPKAMLRIKEKAFHELGRNAVILSNSFSIPGWKPLFEQKIDDLWNSKIYLYEIANQLLP